MATAWIHLKSGGTRFEMASLGGPMRCLVTKGDSNGSVTILEQRLEGPGGPPLHKHFAQDEWITVLEGGPLAVQVDDQRFDLAVGESIFLPRGTPHAFNNLSGSPLRMMSVSTPGGIEKELHEQAEYFLGLNGARPNLDRIAEIWKANGAVVGPPIT